MEDFDIKRAICQLNILKNEVFEMINTNVIPIPEEFGSINEKAICMGSLLKNVTHHVSIMKIILGRMKILETDLYCTIEEMMRSNDIKEIDDSPDIKIYMRKCPQKLVIENEEKLQEYLVEHTEMRLDRSLIKKHIKEGHNIEGAFLTEGESLQIRYKPILWKEFIE